MNKKLNTRILKSYKRSADNPAFLNMLTCYDFQTAQLMNQSSVDMILVGDSLGNVVLGYENTIKVTLNEMTIFSSAVKRGAPDKFVVADLPFGSYSSFEQGLESAKTLFQESGVEAVKIEGAYPWELELIQRLTQIGIPVMGHIGLTPQSVHELGGYYTHGKNTKSAERLFTQAKELEKAGCFALVLECLQSDIATKITHALSIPTIGIGAGDHVDGQVLVINDLLKNSDGKIPSFCQPIADFHSLKKKALTDYQQRLDKLALKSQKSSSSLRTQ